MTSAHKDPKQDLIFWKLVSEAFVLLQLYAKILKSQFFIKLEKSHLGSIPCPLSSPKKMKTTFSEKGSIRLMLSLHTAVTSCKKLQKFCFSIFVKLKKSHFVPGLGIFGPKTSKQDFSPKNYLCQFVRIRFFFQQWNMITGPPISTLIFQ